MNNSDLISLMVEETFNDATRVFSIKKDEERSCFILLLSEETKLEIPFEFGPFKKEATHLELGVEDTYLYPYLTDVLGLEVGVFEFSFEDSLVHFYADDFNSKFAA